MCILIFTELNGILMLFVCFFIYFGSWQFQSSVLQGQAFPAHTQTGLVNSAPSVLLELSAPLSFGPSSSTLTGNSHFQSQWGSDTRFPTALNIFPFSFSAPRLCGSMFINCCAHPSVWVITWGVLRGMFWPDRTLIEVSDWVFFMISARHLRPRPTSPISSPPCRLRCPNMFGSRCDTETAHPWEHTNVAPEQTRLRGLFFSWRHTVCALEGVDSCRTPDSSWESTRLWPPSQLPTVCVWREQKRMWVCGIHTSNCVPECFQP